jgi:ribosome-binding ATPase YchF (GTP1/OBG family)
MDMAGRLEFLADLGLHETGLARVIRAGYDLLHLITFFTVGPQGSARLDRPHRRPPRPQAAGEIHSDFQNAASSAPKPSPMPIMSRLAAKRSAREAGKLRAGRQGLCRARRRRAALQVQCLNRGVDIVWQAVISLSDKQRMAA